MAFVRSYDKNVPSMSSSSSSMSYLAPSFDVGRPSVNSISHLAPAPTPPTIPRLPFRFTPIPLSLPTGDPFYPNPLSGGDGGAGGSRGAGVLGLDGDYGMLGRAPYGVEDYSSWNGARGYGGEDFSWPAPSNSTWSFPQEPGSRAACLSSWMDPSTSLFRPNFDGAIVKDHMPDDAFLPYGSHWHGNHVDNAFEWKSPLGSDCADWLDHLDDDPSMQNQSHATTSVKPSGLAPLSLSKGKQPFSSSPAPRTSMEQWGNYPYGSSIVQTSSDESNQVGYQNAAYFPPAQAFSPGTSETIDPVYQNPHKNLYSHDQLARNFHRNEHNINSPFTLSKLKSNLTPKVEIKPSISSISGANKTGFSLHSLTSSEGLETSSITMSDFGYPNLSAPLNAETDDLSQFSSEIFDRINLLVDSPCWKGILASPFQDGNTSLNSSYTWDVKHEDSRDGSKITTNSQKKHNPLVKDLQSSFPSRVYETVPPANDGIGSFAMNTSCGIENPTSDTFSKPSVNDASSNFNAILNNHVKYSSLHGICHLDKNIEESKASHVIEGLQTSADSHFLVRSLHDLSKFLCHYCCDASILKKDDNELLLMAINNLNACVPKTLQRHAYQGKTSYFHENPSDSCEVQISEDGAYSIQRQSNDQFSSNDMDFKSTMTKEIEKSMKSIFFAEKGKEDNHELNIYKARWIEAEAALCSTRCELILSRKNDGVKSLKQQSSKDSQLLSIAEVYSTRGSKDFSVNSACELARNKESTSDNLQSLSNNTCALGKDVTQIVQSEKPQPLVSPSITSSFEDEHASVMARFRLLKDRISKDDSKILNGQHVVCESTHSESCLDKKQTVISAPLDMELNVATPFQMSHAASTSRGSKDFTVNSACELVRNKESTSDSLQSLSNNTCALGKDVTQIVQSENPQDSVSPSITSSFEDEHASVMARFRLLQDRFIKDDSKILNEQHVVCESIHSESRLDKKQTVISAPLDMELNVATPFQMSHAASTSRESKDFTVNSACELARNKELTSDSLQSLSNNICALGKDVTQIVQSENPQDSVSPSISSMSSISSSFEDEYASFVARFGMLQDCIIEDNSKVLNEQHAHSESRLDKKQTIIGAPQDRDLNVGTPFQLMSPAASSSASNLDLYYSHIFKDGNLEDKSKSRVQYFGGSSVERSLYGRCYSKDYLSPHHDDDCTGGGLEDSGEFDIDLISSQNISPHTLLINDQYMEGYFGAKHVDRGTSDWEHVQKDELC